MNLGKKYDINTQKYYITIFDESVSNITVFEMIKMKNKMNLYVTEFIKNMKKIETVCCVEM